MFQHILVPLDGSLLAEHALPVAASMAGLFGARITLFHVIERNAPSEIHGERHLDDPVKARIYLADIAGRVVPDGINVATHVHDEPESKVSRSIIDHVREFGIDLIIMCTHGRGGLRAFVSGRIAQQVAALGTTPVMFVQPGESEIPPDMKFHHLLVPLDGNVEHEQGLHVAMRIAKAYAAGLHMVMVVHNVGTLPGETAAIARMLPRVTAAMLDLAQQDAEEYLDRQMELLQAAGLDATAEVLRGDPVPAITCAAERIGADLVVVGTHGKTGMEAFWSRSATPHLSRRLGATFLLVPVLRLCA